MLYCCAGDFTYSRALEKKVGGVCRRQAEQVFFIRKDTNVKRYRVYQHHFEQHASDANNCRSDIKAMASP
jgi:hypothetical protein